MTGGVTETEVRSARHKLGVRPMFKRIDTCAADFEARTPYMSSTDEAPSFGEGRTRTRPTNGRTTSFSAAGPTGQGRGSSANNDAPTRDTRWEFRHTTRTRASEP